jgi:hypothetical protein
MKSVFVWLCALMLVGATGAIAEETEYRCGHGPNYGYGMMHHGYGMGPGMGPGMMGPGYGMGPQGYDRDRSYEPIPEAKARKMIEQYLADNLKGFEIVKLDKQRMPMGIMYWAVIKDDKGNEMELHLNPWGYIRGPFIR